MSDHGFPARLTLADVEAAHAELRAIGPLPEPDVKALEAAARLGLFALGVPCCAGWDGARFRVVALEPVTPLDLNIARMKLARWHPEAAEVIELAAAGRWR